MSDILKPNSNQVQILKVGTFQGTKKRLLQLCEDQMWQIDGQKVFQYKKCFTCKIEHDKSKISFYYKGKFRQLSGNITTLDWIYKRIKGEVTTQEYLGQINSSEFIIDLTGKAIADNIMNNKERWTFENNQEVASDHSNDENGVIKESTIQIFHTIPKNISKRDFFEMITQKQCKINNYVRNQYFENDSQQLEYSFLNFKFNIKSSLTSTDSQIFSEDMNNICQRNSDQNQRNLTHALINDIEICSISLELPVEPYPFTTTETFDDDAKINVFNEIISCLFNTNMNTRMERGYDKYTIQQFGPLFLTLIGKFQDKMNESDLKNVKSFNQKCQMQELIQDYQDIICTEEDFPQRYYNSDKIIDNVDSLNQKQYFTQIIDLVQRHVFKFVLNTKYSQFEIDLDRYKLNEFVTNCLNKCPTTMTDFNYTPEEISKYNKLKEELLINQSDNKRVKKIKKILRDSNKLFSIINVNKGFLNELRLSTESDTTVKQAMQKNTKQNQIMFQNKMIQKVESKTDDNKSQRLEIIRLTDDKKIIIKCLEFDFTMMDNYQENIENTTKDLTNNNISSPMNKIDNQSNYNSNMNKKDNEDNIQSNKQSKLATISTGRRLNDEVASSPLSKVENNNIHSSPIKNIEIISPNKHGIIKSHDKSFEEFKTNARSDTNTNQKIETKKHNKFDSLTTSQTNSILSNNQLKESKNETNDSENYSSNRTRKEENIRNNKPNLNTNNRNASNTRNTPNARNSNNTGSIQSAIDSQFNCNTCSNICNERETEHNEF